VIPLTSDRHDDWLRVYNKGRDNLSGFVPIHPQELGVMIRNQQCTQEDMYLALQGRRPTAVARFLQDAASRMSFIADLVSVPDTSAGIEALVGFFMDLARENGSTSLTSWTFMAQVSTPDTLSKFTFDTRRVRHEMSADLALAKVTGPPRKPRARECNRKDSSLKISFYDTAPSIRPLELFELRDEVSLDWQPRFAVFREKSGGKLMVASRSKHKRKEGRIDLTDLATKFAKQNELLSELIQDLAFSLYHDGVRRVKLEIDAGIELKQALMDFGFEVRRTLLEMCLEIMQD